MRAARRRRRRLRKDARRLALVRRLIRPFYLVREGADGTLTVGLGACLYLWLHGPIRNPYPPGLPILWHPARVIVMAEL